MELGLVFASVHLMNNFYNLKCGFDKSNPYKKRGQVSAFCVFDLHYVGV